MVSERKLKKWRREALKGIELNPASDEDVTKQLWNTLTTYQGYILCMTQELLDNYLLKGKQNERKT